MNIFEKLLFRAKTGASINVIEKPVEETVIKFKDVYISILESEDGIESLSWTDNIGFVQTPVRDFWTSAPPKRKK